MSHNHHHHATGEKGLLISIFLNFVITAAEVIGGLVSGSLSLISDALHNFNDAIAMVGSYVAIQLSKKPSDNRKTFGYKRAQILVALFNSMLLVAAALLLFRESILRMFNPVPIRGALMLIVATIGLLANLFSVLLLRESARESLNVRTAYLHLIGDTLSSFGVVTGGIVVILWNWYLIDPILTVLIGIYILKEGIKAFIESVEILMEAAPPDIDPDEIKKVVESIDGIANIHHLHVWRLDDKSILLEAHVDMESDIKVSEADAIREKIQRVLHDEFGIGHVTLQMEFNSCSEKSLIRQSS